MEKIILIVGLGNPGKEYENTRHNIGFATIQNAKLNMQNCSEWKLNTYANAEVTQCQIDGMKIILAKPQTFMNSSGEAARTLLKNLKLKVKNLWIIHDDLDLPLGTIRVRLSGSSGGHNGVQSIIDSIGTDEFARIRIGIASERDVADAKKFVLQKFSKKEQLLLKKVMEKAGKLIEEMLEKGVRETTLAI